MLAGKRFAFFPLYLTAAVINTKLFLSTKVNKKVQKKIKKVQKKDQKKSSKKSFKKVQK